jgi:glycine betaine/proline transport system substrate-binding protein
MARTNTTLHLSRRDFIAAGLALSANGCFAEQTFASPEEAKVVKIGQNAWIGSAINVAIAQFLLRDELGLGVQVVRVGEAAQWPLLAKGDLHASLEVWPLRNRLAIAEFVNSGLVDYGGQLGPVAKAGWYVPTYMLTQNPALATWEGLEDEAVIAALRTPTTGTKGELRSGPRSWNTHDEAIIRNLELSLQVVYAASEEALLDDIETLYGRRQSFLFYLWFPHWIHGVYDFTNVELPPYDAICAAKEESAIDCDYPAERLIKVFWPNLRLANARAHAFLSAFSLPATQQIALAAAAQLGEKTVEGAAREWIKDNRPVWSQWIPPA